MTKHLSIYKTFNCCYYYYVNLFSLKIYIVIVLKCVSLNIILIMYCLILLHENTMFRKQSMIEAKRNINLAINPNN